MQSKYDIEDLDVENKDDKNEEEVSQSEESEDGEEKEEIQYGTTISLELQELSECSLTIDGFMKPKVQAEQVTFSNQDKALFMVYPSFNTTNLNKISQIPLMNKKEKKAFEKRVIEDYKQNLDIFQKMKGTPVQFDQPIQLLNINVNKFLSCNYHEAEEEKQNFQLELSDFSSKNTLFKILPSYIHQDKKDAVVLSSDIIMIVSAEKYLGRDPYIQCNVQKFKDSVASHMTNQQQLLQQQQQQAKGSMINQLQLRPIQNNNESGIEQTGSKLFQNNTKPNKGLFGHYDTTITEYAGQEELNEQRKPGSQQQQSAIAGQSVFNKPSSANPPTSALDKSFELDSNPLEDNSKAHQAVRPSQVHKFKHDVDTRNQNSQNLQGQAAPLDNSNLMQLNNQNIIPANPTPVFPQNQYRIQPMTLNSFEKARLHETEVNVSLEAKTKWVIRSFSPVVDDDEAICYGDKIWLHHLETGNNLVTQRNIVMREEEKQPSLDNTDQIKLDKNRQRQCIKFEATAIKENSFQKYSGNTKGMWIIEKNEKLKGGPTQFNQIVYFKHFSTRKYLQLVRYHCGKDEYAYYFDMADEPSKSCSFVLMKLPSSGQKNQKYLMKDSFFYFKSVEYRVFVNISFRKTNSHLEEYLGYNQGVDVSSLPHDEAAFKLFRSTHSESIETYFLTQCYPIMSRNVDNFALQARRKTANKVDSKSKDSLEQLDQTIKHIKKFCKNQIVLTSLDNQRNFSKVSSHRQKIIQEQYIIDELIEIVKCIVSEADLKKIREEKKYENYKTAQLEFSKSTLLNVEKMKKIVLKEKGIDLNNSLMKFGKMSFKTGSEGHAFFFAINKLEEARVQKSTQYLADKIEILKRIYILLTTICLDNPDNQNLVYKKLTSFQNHAAYIKEAADFVISIVSQNETILSNLSDDIKIVQEIDSPIQKKRMSLINTGFADSRKNTGLISDDVVEKKQTDNLILFFKENAINQYKEQEKRATFNLHSKDMNILNFFRNICKFQGKGVSVNQEQIHKFCYVNDKKTDFYKSIFYKVQGEEKGLKVDLHGKKIQIGNQKKDTEDLSPEIYSYLIDQIHFCSDLCLSRNYLWKRDLKGDFPVDFVFKIIFDNQIDDELRSAFCNLGLTLYIDHEPLNKRQVPNMCRIFRSDKEILKNRKKSIMEVRRGVTNSDGFDDEDDENAIKENPIYRYTIEKIIKYINQEYKKLRKSNEEFLESQNRKSVLQNKLKKDETEADAPITTNFFENILTLDIIKMLATFVKFDILALINQQSMYKSIVTTLLQLLEYDKNYRNYSYVINKVRQERYKNAITIQKKNKLLSNFTGFIVNGALTIAKAGQEMAGEIAGMVGAMIGLQYVKSNIESDDEQLEATNSQYSKHPMIGGLLTLKSMFQSEQSENEDKVEVEVKVEICELFIFQQNLRMDYLLSNFLSWFDTISKKHQRFNSKAIIAEIEEDLPTVIPEIYKTGIDSIEERITQMNDPKSDGFENLTNMLSFKKRKTFMNYLSSEEFIPNLDSLLEGSNDSVPGEGQGGGGITSAPTMNPNIKTNKTYQPVEKDETAKQIKAEVKQEVLPSLLCGFFMTKNHKVEDTILEVLRNCFNQTDLLFQNLYILEVLFDQRDIVPYQLLRKKIDKLRQFAEESEVWLNDFLQTKQPPEKMRQTQQTLSEINELFYFDVKIVDDKIVLPPDEEIEVQRSKKRQIDKVRQKVFTFLMGHYSLINLVRDSQNQMAKLLRSNSVSNQAKSVIHKLLSSLYYCLSLYCDNFEENQNILANYTSFFLDEIEFDFGQLDLVCSIYKNNKFLCETFPDNLSSFLTNNISVIGRQQRFLKLFKIILSFKDHRNKVVTNLTENQIKVIQWFLPKDNSDKSELARYSKLLYANLDTRNKLQISFDFEESSNNNSSDASSSKDIPYYYHAELLELFIYSLKGDESSSINISKLKKLFSQSYLLDMLLREDTFVPLEKNYPYGNQIIDNQQQQANIVQEKPKKQRNRSSFVIDYSENFFIDDEKEGLKILKPKIIDFLLAVFFNEDKPITDNMKDHKRFSMIFQMELERLHRKIDQHPHDYIQYICGKFLKLALFYLKKIIIHDHQQEYKDSEEFQLLFEISKKLFDIRFQFDEMLSKQEYQEYSDFMKEVNPEYHKQYIDEIRAALKPEPKKEEESQSQGLWKAQYNWKIFLNICRNSDVIKENLELEMSVLAEAVLKIKDMFPEQYRKEFKIDIQYQEVLKKFIQYLQLGIVNKANPLNMIFVFDLLTQILEDQETEKSLEEMQNLLDSLDASKMCLHLLSDSKSNPLEKDLFNSLLKFLIKLLEGGNKQIQKTIFEYFQTFPKSEVIFWKFHSIIHDFIEDLKEKKKIEIMKIQNEILFNMESSMPLNHSFGQGESKKGLSSSKNPSDHIDNAAETLSNPKGNKNYKEPLKDNKKKSKDDKKEDDEESSANKSNIDMEFDEEKDPYRKQQKMVNSTILMRVLRVSQLFCEGHNLDLQNYIRYQKNSRTNYDMVSIIIDLLYVFYDNINEEIFENMVKCLDTLIEFVQGPCKMNQETIIDSKFFQFAEDILDGYDQKKQHLKQKSTIIQQANTMTSSLNSSNNNNLKSSYARKSTKTKSMIQQYAAMKQAPTSLKPWMIEQIKYKTMVLVTSLLELNSEPLVIKRIMRSLPLEILKKNLISIFRKHKEIYQDQYIIQCFGHFDGEPEDDSENEIRHYNYIIETGFFIFFLLSYYTDLDENDLDAEISVKLNEIKNDFKDSKSLFSLKKGIISQLYNFVYAILESVFQIVEGVSKKIQEQLETRQVTEFDLEKQAKEDKETFKLALNFFNKNAGSIEIVREGKLERIRFILLPFCHYLPKSNKTEFHDNVDRDSTHSKLSGLVEKSKEIIQICKHEEQLFLFFNRNKFIGIFANSVDLWRDIAFLLTIIINAFILISYFSGTYTTSSEAEHNRLWEPELGVDGSVSVDKTKGIFQTTGIIMIICSSFVVLFFLCKRAPLYLKRAWEENESIISDKNQMKFIIFTKYLVIICSSLVKVLTNPEVVYYLLFGTLAFIATLYHPFLFAFHLTEFLLRFPTLRNILKSVSDSLVSLALTFVLIIMLFYFQAVIGFLEFYEDYYNQCEQLYLCVFHTFIMTFQNNGGIGGFLNNNNSNILDNGQSYRYWRFIFDNISFFSVMLISVQIFAGVIIDKFGSLREREHEKNTDIFQTCFICGHSRELFERQSDIGFDSHIKQDHYLWNYLFYIAFINWKEKTDHSGIESFVYQKLDEGDHSWFPIQRAIILKDHSEEDQEEYLRREKFKQESDNFQKIIGDVQQSQKFLQEIISAKKSSHKN